MSKTPRRDGGKLKPNLRSNESLSEASSANANSLIDEEEPVREDEEQTYYSQITSYRIENICINS